MSATGIKQRAVRLAASICDTGRSFGTDKRGNVLITTALFATPLLLAVGVAVDTAETYRAETNFQNALDAGALMAAKTITRGGTDDEALAAAKRVFQANLSTTLPRSTGTIKLQETNGNCTEDGIVATGTLRHQVFFDAFHKAFKETDADHANLSGETVVRCGSKSVEVAMVLDNSGSMGGTKIASLKTAATDLVTNVNTSMQGSLKPGAVKFSLVPFSTMVNVGKNNKNKSWMDTAGISPIHHYNLDWAAWPTFARKQGNKWVRTDNNATLTRFTIYDELGEDWDGCTEARPHPYNTNDDTPVNSKPETQFVPTFAPDEPTDWSGRREQTFVPGQPVIYCSSFKYAIKRGRYYFYYAIVCGTWSDGETGEVHSNGNTANYYSSDYGGRGVWEGPRFTNSQTVPGPRIVEEQYPNDYIEDDHNFGVVSGVLSMLSSDHTGTASTPDTKQHTRQKWPWKYFRENGNRAKMTKLEISASGSSTTYTGGPNNQCESNPITPLTQYTSTINTAIGNMKAKGLTNIGQGAVWGWRTLSEGQPFDQGRPSSRADNKKVMVIMTDGENTNYPTWEKSRINKSNYGAYGHALNGRIFEGYTSVQPTHNLATYSKAMDSHLTETCENAKKDGIQIYSVAFDVPNGSEIKRVLKACASPVAGKQAYFDASNSTELKSAFKSIGESIAELAIAK